MWYAVNITTYLKTPMVKLSHLELIETNGTGVVRAYARLVRFGGGSIGNLFQGDNDQGDD